MRVLYYNIRHGQGVAGIFSNRRIARVVAECRPDLVAFSEVYRIPGLYDQPAMLAEFTGMTPSFNALIPRPGGVEGDLILSADPPRSLHNIGLGHGRGCMIAEFGTGAGRFAFAATHLCLRSWIRPRQVALLAEKLPRDVPMIVAGDFNAPVSELAPLRDLLCFPEDVPATYPSVAPWLVLDHVGYTSEWRLESLRAVRSWASDHLPLLAELTMVG